MTNSQLMLRQIDSALRALRESKPPLPRGGWLKTIRTALGMTTRQLAARLETSQSAVVEFEQREAANTITLGTLRRAAAAMDCDLVYALVPRRPLGETLERRAEAVARRKLAPIAHSMSLEGQAVTDSATEDQVQELARELLERRRRELWR